MFFLRHSVLVAETLRDKPRDSLNTLSMHFFVRCLWLPFCSGWLQSWKLQQRGHWGQSAALYCESWGDGTAKSNRLPLKTGAASWT